MKYSEDNKDKLVEKIQKMLEDVEKKSEINVMFVDKDTGRKNKYKTYMLQTENKHILPTVISSLENIKDNINNKVLCEYDLELSIDDTIQIVDKESVVNSKDILKNISIQYSDENIISNKVILERLNFIVIQICFQGSSIYLFERYIHPTSAYKKAAKFTLNGSKAVPLSQEIIAIGSAIDALLYGEQFFVFNRNSFNSIFDYKDVFKRIINDNSQKIIQSELLDNAIDFINDCEMDGRYLPRLTKIILSEGFDHVKENNSNLKKLIKEFNLGVKIDKSNKLIYCNKNDIPEILNLLLRHYVNDALTGDKMLAKAIEKYKI